MRQYYAILALMLLVAQPLDAVNAQEIAAGPEATTEEQALANAILVRIPDVPYTAPALGRGAARPANALVHSRAIHAAVRAQRARWETFARRANWQHFDVDRDLPLLVSAVTMRESAFQSVVRLDGGAHAYELPVIMVQVDGHLRRRTPSADIGVMQVRAPSPSASACGLRGRADGERMLTDLNFAYGVGVCVMTNHMERYIDAYNNPTHTRLRYSQRPPIDLEFFGVSPGPRRGSPQAQLARELLVMERYNWGGADLYLHPRGAGYARRLMTEFERFQELVMPGAATAGSVAMGG